MLYVVVACGLLSICQFVMLLCAGVWIQRILDRKILEVRNQIQGAIEDLVTAPAPDQPSKLAQLLDLAGSVVGSAAARSIMASLAADKSHAVRVANSASDELEAQQNPIMSILAGTKRGRGAGLLRLAGLLGGILGTGTGPAGSGGVQLPLSGGNGNQSVAARLKSREGG